MSERARNLYTGARFFLISVAEYEPDTLSTGIEAVISADYSHVAILVEFDSPIRAPRVFESTIPKSRECALDLALEGSFIKHKIEFTDLIKHDESYCIGYMRALMNVPYGYDQFPSLVTSLAQMINVGDNDLGKLVCSEFCAIVIEHFCDVNLWANEDFVNPRECIEVFEKYIKEQKNGSRET